jgi:hypothetical protein
MTDLDDTNNVTCEEKGPSDVACPFCAQKSGDCDHFLAIFDCTFAGEGEFGIGLKGGALFNVEAIGQLFPGIAEYFARIRYRSGVSGPVTSPKISVLTDYMDAAKNAAIDPADYRNKEEDFVSDYLTSIVNYASYVREAIRDVIIETLSVELQEEFTATDIPCLSSDYELWFCKDAEGVALSLGQTLEYLSKEFHSTSCDILLEG